MLKMLIALASGKKNRLGLISNLPWKISVDEASACLTNVSKNYPCLALDFRTWPTLAFLDGGQLHHFGATSFDGTGKLKKSLFRDLRLTASAMEREMSTG